MVGRPWLPDRLVAERRVLLTDSLATWWPGHGVSVTGGKKTTRYDVDARDVTPANSKGDLSIEIDGVHMLVEPRRRRLRPRVS